MHVKKEYRPVIDMGEIPHPSGLRLVTNPYGGEFYLTNEFVHNYDPRLVMNHEVHHGHNIQKRTFSRTTTST